MRDIEVVDSETPNAAGDPPRQRRDVPRTRRRSIQGHGLASESNHFMARLLTNDRPSAGVIVRVGVGPEFRAWRAPEPLTSARLADPVNAESSALVAQPSSGIFFGLMASRMIS